jgi:hypothetical protein
MELLPNEENLLERVLSVLFPVELGSMDLNHTAEYQERIGRKGIENKPGIAFGRVVGSAQEKRVFHLSGRTV